MVSALLSRVVILVFGTLYPAYKSYKAVKTKNVKEYVKWMMYWIVFALFTFVETFADIFVAWLPFYYELKILFVLWLLSPATKGSSILYRKFVHPQLSKREQDIDAHLERVTDQGYTALTYLGQRGVKVATDLLFTTAMKGHVMLTDLKRSYSQSDVSDERRQKRAELEEISDDEDEADNRMIAESYQEELDAMGGREPETSDNQRRKSSRKNKDGVDDISEDLETRVTRQSTQAGLAKVLSRHLDQTASCPQTPLNNRSPPPTPTPPSSPRLASAAYTRYLRSLSSNTPPGTPTQNTPPSSPWRSRAAYTNWQ